MNISRSSGLPELLAPAGSMEKLRTAFAYGADAAYLGLGTLNLRAKTGFSPSELEEALNLAHSGGKRIYLCLNILARQEHLHLVRETLAQARHLPLDGLIIADPGIIDLARRTTPHIPIHLSTQAGASNAESVRFWKRAGCTRVNLVRELSHQDIRAVTRACPEMEIEVFVHGAMCMAVSGRCLMSSALCDRPANLGLCAHPCRYEYRPMQVALEEKTRPGRPTWEIQCDPPFSKILSPEDLCLLPYMRWFWKNKITALKIEGRMKSSAYLALTVGTYRAALDQLARGEFDPRPHLQRLGTATTRPLGTGFFLTRPRILKPPRKKRDFGPLLGRILEKTGSEIWRVQAKQAWDTRRDAAVLLPDMRLAPLAAAGYQVEDAEGVVQTVVHPGWTGFLRTADSAPAPDLFICRPDSGV